MTSKPKKACCYLGDFPILPGEIECPIYVQRHVAKCRLGIMGDLLRKVPDWIEDQGEVRSVLEKGRDPIAAHPGQFRGYFALASEIAPLHEAIGFETLLLAGVEPAISADDESYNKLEGEQRRLWLDLLFEISTEQSIIGASRHPLYIGKKRLL